MTAGPACGPLHAHQRLARTLAAELGSGMWRSGDGLPSEAELARGFRVSRKTVRKALAEAEREGLISKAQGRNSEFRGRAIGRDGERLAGFPTDARAAGFRPSTRLTCMRERQAGLTEAHALRIAFGAPVTEILRLRRLEGRPAVSQSSVLPAGLGRCIGRDGLAGASLYELIRELLGDELVLGFEHLSIARATPEIAKDLNLPEGGAVLRVQRVVTDRGGSPVEYSVSLVRDGYFRL